MPRSDRCEYIRECVRAVYGKEPEEARVPPYEWGLIDQWMRREIPLATVLQSVEQVCGPGASRPRKLSIRYLHPVVLEEEERRRRALAAG